MFAHLKDAWTEKRLYPHCQGTEDMIPLHLRLVTISTALQGTLSQTVCSVHSCACAQQQIVFKNNALSNAAFISFTLNCGAEMAVSSLPWQQEYVPSFLPFPFKVRATGGLHLSLVLSAQFVWTTSCSYEKESLYCLFIGYVWMSHTLGSPYTLILLIVYFS